TESAPEPIGLPDPPARDEPAPTAASSDPLPEPEKKDTGMQEVDLTEAADKLPDSCRAYLGDSECLVSADRKQVLIRTANEMGKMILSSQQNAASIRAALFACGLTDAGAAIEITTGAKPKAKKLPVDELAGF
ncbi:MAG: hypothetical protein J6V24_12225, partial [Clostridia bacterium]|nr:hypothetical protein [Clostridia bacterium]